MKEHRIDGTKKTGKKVLASGGTYRDTRLGSELNISVRSQLSWVLVRSLGKKSMRRRRGEGPAVASQKYRHGGGGCSHVGGAEWELGKIQSTR